MAESYWAALASQFISSGFYIGCGFIGGVGMGLGYITPVSILIKWFPNRHRMATGFAIMGCGGGALIGAPLSVWLMTHFAGHGVFGVAKTLVVMGVLYFIAMCLGGSDSAYRLRAGFPPGGRARRKRKKQ